MNSSSIVKTAVDVYRPRFRRVSIPAELGLTGPEAKECKRLLNNGPTICCVTRIHIQPAEECNLILLPGDDDLYAIQPHKPLPSGARLVDREALQDYFKDLLERQAKKERKAVSKAR